MFDERLNRRENEVMRAMVTLSGGRERFLAAPYDVLALLPPKGKYDERTLERLLLALETDGYFELVASERKGERVFVVHMREAGLAYARSGVQRRRKLYFKLGMAVATAVLSFFIGLLLRAVFL